MSMTIKKFRRVAALKKLRRAAALLLVFLLLGSHVPAQRRRARQPQRRTSTTAASVKRGAQQSPTASSPASKTGANGSEQKSSTPEGAASKVGKPATGDAAAQAVETLSFESLLPAESYVIYGEVRDIGQLLHSGEVVKLIEPLWRLTGMPREVKEVLDFLQAHEEPLADARLMFATEPNQKSLPQLLVVLEFSSVETAQKFAPEFYGFLSSIAPPDVQLVADGLDGKTVAAPQKREQPAQKAPQHAAQGRKQKTRQAKFDEKTGEAPKSRLPFYIKRTGRLVVASESRVNLKSFAAASSKLLFDNPNFKAARARFASEPLFIYFDYALMQRQIKAITDAIEAEERLAREAQKKDAGKQQATALSDMDAPPDASADELPPDDITVAAVPLAEETPTESERAAQAQAVGPQPSLEGTPGVGVAMDGASVAELGTSTNSTYAALPMILGSMLLGMRGGDENWQMPQAISLAAAFEGDDLAVRLLLLDGSQERKTSLVPFAPMLVAGPALAPEAAAYAPAETDIFVAASLDLPQIYDRIMAAAKRDEERMEEMRKEAAASRKRKQEEQAKETNARADAKETPPPADDEEEVPPAPSFIKQLEAMEKLLGFKVKEDIVGSLGNEVAVALPGRYLNPQPPPPNKASTSTDKTASSGSDAASGQAGRAEKAVQTNPVILISLKNKEALQALLPRLLTLFNLGGMGAAAPSLKSGDVEVMSFGPGAFAFIGNYLAASTDALSVLRVAEAYTQGQTLAAQENFRRASTWRPRQVLGQVYVSNDFLKGMFAGEMREIAVSADDESKNFLAQFNLEPGAITHAVVNEGDGPLHELHLPRNLLSMFVAYTTVSEKHAPIAQGEAQAISILHAIHDAETTYKETKGKGNFGTLEELMAGGFLSRSTFEFDYYRFDLTVSGNKYEAVAIPAMYPDRGRRSFFVDETGVIRGGDKGGGRASATDEAIN